MISETKDFYGENIWKEHTWNSRITFTLTTATGDGRFLDSDQLYQNQLIETIHQALNPIKSYPWKELHNICSPF